VVCHYSRIEWYYPRTLGNFSATSSFKMDALFFRKNQVLHVYNIRG
jgi:hypothetical protein